MLKREGYFRKLNEVANHGAAYLQSLRHQLTTLGIVFGIPAADGRSPCLDGAVGKHCIIIAPSHDPEGGGSLQGFGVFVAAQGDDGRTLTDIRDKQDWGKSMLLTALLTGYSRTLRGFPSEAGNFWRPAFRVRSLETETWLSTRFLNGPDHPGRKAWKNCWEEPGE